MGCLMCYWTCAEIKQIIGVCAQGFITHKKEEKMVKRKWAIKNTRKRRMRENKLPYVTLQSSERDIQVAKMDQMLKRKMSK